MDHKANKNHVKQSRLLKNFKKHGYKTDDKYRLDSYREECKKAIYNSWEMYLKQVGINLADPINRKKAYRKWSIKPPGAYLSKWLFGVYFQSLIC